MTVPGDVLAILEEIRNTEGAFRRARMVGRMWTAARELDGEERQELAIALAQRFSPGIADRLEQGAVVANPELLGLIRSLSRADAEEIEGLIDGLTTEGGLEALGEQAMASLQDDLAGANLGELIDDPDHRTSLFATAAAGLAEDLGVVETEPEDEPPTDEDADGAESPAEEGTTAHETSEQPAAEEPAAEETAAEETAAEESVPDGPAFESGTDDQDAGGHGNASPTVPDPEPEAPPVSRDDFGIPIEPTEPTDRAAGPPESSRGEQREEVGRAVDDDLVAAIERATSPITRLRLFRSAPADTFDHDIVRMLRTIPDGWQRRRAVDAALAMRKRSVAATSDLVATLETVMDRRWVVTRAGHLWDLPTAERHQLAAVTGTGRPTSRLPSGGASQK